jgi:hypothetical protein
MKQGVCIITFESFINSQDRDVFLKTSMDTETLRVRQV